MQFLDFFETGARTLDEGGVKLHQLFRAWSNEAAIEANRPPVDVVFCEGHDGWIGVAERLNKQSYGVPFIETRDQPENAPLVLYAWSEAKSLRKTIRSDASCKFGESEGGFTRNAEARIA